MNIKRLLPSLAILVIFILATFGLERMPPLWWDEGWTISVARNWVEDGFYGHYLNGQPAAPQLAGGFPVVVPVALSFRLLGVGVWQARLPSVIFLFASLILLYTLAHQLYNRQVAAGAIAAALLMSVGPWLNPLIIGRQVLGETPVTFYLLAGYAFLLLSLRRSAWFILPAILFWAIAVRTKAQVPPFWLASLLLPLAIAILKRWHRPAILLIVAITGTHLLADYGINRLQISILSGHTVWGTPMKELFSITALVLNGKVRLDALSTVLTFGLPTLLGLGYAAWKALGIDLTHPPSPLPSLLGRGGRGVRSDTSTLRLALLGLAGSWLAWYALLGMSWVRYLFVPIFVGSLFVSALLYELTGHFNLRQTIHRAASLLLRRSSLRQSGGALLAVILVSVTVPFNLLTFDLIYDYVSYNPWARPAAEQVADYINANTPAGALIETFDSEMLFFLERKVHYPPGDLQVAAVRRLDFQEEVPLTYDPLVADPDYVVLGHFSRTWEIYDAAIASGAFREIATFPGYQIFERVRSP